ncbi:hypothetical protein PSEUDO8Z_160519 [Pseudomonas sp. 8Z]|nr:hypothetical protein PSEUDO8Z_160519 [Pseudomonas sp. 8Z]
MTVQRSGWASYPPMFAKARQHRYIASILSASVEFHEPL